ncbi:MAG: IS1634 family transposase [Actinomycetia bacterium]|nr:IS1634 family transposase [Actinomycetes bacterium]
MSRDAEKLKRYNISGIPLVKQASDLLGLKFLFGKHIPSYGNEKASAEDALMLLVWNITLGRQPLYELGGWVKDIDPGCHGMDKDTVGAFNDDRFARALDKLYSADRATLMTEIVVGMIKKVGLDTGRVHNDSTTVKAYGKIPGTTKTGLKMARGVSKDHRPDLAQLVFSLTVSSDGAVPVHYKTYPGNRTDDTTHIETWRCLRSIIGRADFIYVADCKVCTQKNLSAIVSGGGRVITTMPDTWNEAKAFKEKLLAEKVEKKQILRKQIAGSYEYYSLLLGDYRTKEGGYRIYWYLSSQKRKLDRVLRQERIKKAEKELTRLSPRLNKRELKEKEQIRKAVESILKRYRCRDFINVDIIRKIKKKSKKVGRGRPGPAAEYRIETLTHYSLYWEQDKERLARQRRVDGIFPLLSTDTSIGPREVLNYYKYQPRLEKRFNQFKSVHEAAPVLFKNIERVEGIMFLFFVALIIQGIIERKVRMAMKEKGIKSLPIYPEYRKSFYPTTSRIFYNFDGISSYKILKNGKVVKEFKDSLSSIQKMILGLLDMDEDQYWGRVFSEM